MAIKRATFDQQHYNKYDDVGKRVVAHTMERLTDLKAIIPIESKDVDLFMVDKDNGKVVLAVEAEIRASWQSLKFPWSDYTVAARKQWALRYEEGMSKLIITVNYDHTAMIIAKGNTVINSPTEERRNRICPDGEHFYIVPYERVTYVDIRDEMKDFNVGNESK